MKHSTNSYKAINMKTIFTLISLIIISVTTQVAFAQSTYVPASGTYDGPLHTTASPVVVELFSSENCPACPPADEYVGELAKSDNIIALSCHVDYFGKTSASLGREFCTKRQSRYMKQIGRKSHFTPQMMVNGHMSEIGYETANVAASITKGRSEKVTRINIKSKASEVYNYNLPAKKIRNETELWMAIYQKPLNVSNREKKTTYNNVMRQYTSLGDWDGAPIQKAFSPIFNENAAGFVIVAQEKKSGKIIAAGDYRF